VLVLSGVAVQAQAGRQPPGDPGPTLARSMDSIRSAFLANDAAQLARLFPTRKSVLVQMAPLERGGVLGPGPLKAFLSRLVAGRSTVAFEVPATEHGAARDVRTHVKVRWTYRETGSATLQVESLYLALRYAPEDAEWQIVEMKTASR